MKIKTVTKEYPITILENKDNFVAASLRILAHQKTSMKKGSKVIYKTTNKRPKVSPILEGIRELRKNAVAIRNRLYRLLDRLVLSFFKGKIAQTNNTKAIASKIRNKDLND